MLKDEFYVEVTLMTPRGRHKWSSEHIAGYPTPDYIEKCFTDAEDALTDALQMPKGYRVIAQHAQVHKIYTLKQEG